MRSLQEWAKFTKSKTARHKLAKFLKEHHDLLPEHYKALPAGDLSSGKAREFDERPVAGSKLSPSKDRGQTVWLAVEGEDGPGLLAEMAQIIDKHGHDVKVEIVPYVVKRLFEHIGFFLAV